MPKCEDCGKSFVESESAAVHYSEPAKYCLHCDIKRSSKPGDWLQKEDGEYYQVPLATKYEAEENFISKDERIYIDEKIRMKVWYKACAAKLSCGESAAYAIEQADKILLAFDKKFSGILD